jgi:hypothetical protein
LAACSDAVELFIQGKWATGNAHYWTEWNFDRGTYSYQYDDGFTAIYETGRYRLVESDDDFITIELFNQVGGIPSIEERNEVKIKIDRDNNRVRIRNRDYTRVFSSTLEELTTRQAP